MFNQAFSTQKRHFVSLVALCQIALSSYLADSAWGAVKCLVLGVLNDQGRIPKTQLNALN